jgi:RNA polymerase sigma factor (sigma-70 family)
MNCAFTIPSLLSGDQQKDADWLLIQRVLFFADQKAFSELMANHQIGVRRMLSRFKLDAAMVDDLVQDTFLRAYLSLGSYTAKARFSTWLYRIAFNLAVDKLRKKSIDCCSLDDLQDIVLYDDKNDWEFQRDMGLAMQALSREQERAVVLCFMQGYSHAEVAVKMCMPLGTVKTHIMRAKKILAKRLSPWAVSHTSDLRTPIL